MYDAQISRYRASLDAGGDPAVIGPWIAETQAKKVTAQAEIRTATGHRQLSRDDIAAVVAAFADLAQVVREADPADKAELYAQLKLTLTYQPDQRLVEATVTADGVAAAWWRPGPALAGSGGCSWPR